MPRATSNGIELEYEIIGEGEPLLLIMGLGAQMVLWPDEFCERLAARGYQVIRFDNRDIGLSTKLDDAGVPRVMKMIARSFVGLPVTAPYDLRDMADDTVGLLDHLGIESAHVVGASMGGMITQTMAIMHPHRMRTMTSIMSTTGGRRVSYGHPKSIATLLQKPAKSRSEAIERQVEFFRVTGGSLARDEDKVRERAGRAYDRSFYPKGVARQIAAITASGNRTAALRYVRVPALVMHGSEDSLVPLRGGKATAKAIPGARFHLVRGMGHDFPEPAFPEIVDAISSHAS